MKQRSTLALPFGGSPSPESIHRHAIASIARGAVERILAIREIDTIYSASVGAPGAGAFPDRVLETLGISLMLPDADRARIPSSGGVVVVANHPYGAVEGMAILSLLLEARSDVRVMANAMLHRLPALREHAIFVDPFGGRDAARANIRGVRQAIDWVRSGGMLLMFPAGEVSHRTLRQPRVLDPEWSATTARIIRKGEARALPVYVDGGNSGLFQFMGLIHPRLRTALLPREVLRRRGMPLELRIGGAIPFSRLREFGCDRAMTGYLRERTYFLERRIAPARSVPSAPALRRLPVAGETPAELLRREMEGMPSGNVLLEHGDYRVAYAEAAAIPHMLREIGRLRELAFRDVGEGTGRRIDLDRFDSHYDHLVLWNHASRRIIGAYRIGRVDTIVDRFGIDGLYTSTLFRYHESLPGRLGGALELGRSFVVPAHQKNFNALMLLWKGIGGYLRRHPGYRTLFGPVSISAEYTTASRELMAAYLRRHLSDGALAGMVGPRSPFPDRAPGRGGKILPDSISTLDDLGALVEELEEGSRGVPVLLRHYLKLGGRLLGLNVDGAFANVLDALVMVDLTRTEPALLARYLGGEDAAGAFLDRHRGAGDVCAGRHGRAGG